MTTAPPNERSPAVFLDRDGTIMRDVDYCGDPAKVEILPGATAALTRLKAAGFRLVVITNQSGIARGYFTEAAYREVEHELSRQIGGDLLDATYFCPDAPDAGSKRRKPQPAMVFEAADDLQLDLNRSYFVGDKLIDAECGRNAGVRTILVQSGCEQHDRKEAADWIVSDLAEAADRILRNAI